MARPPVLTATPLGIYCEAGDFYIDPWGEVRHALVTHAHADHARAGAQEYLASASSVPILRHRLGEGARVSGMAYGETLTLRGARVSFHPAGHVLGSAQIRIEVDGEVWVFSGDYKRAEDESCEPFEPLRCHTFITEATFALPIFQWAAPRVMVEAIFQWWQVATSRGRAAVLFCYTLGKAQRILAALRQHTDRRIFIHGAMAEPTECYRRAGVAMLPTEVATEKPRGHPFAGELVLAPLSARGSVWMRRMGEFESAFASGHMLLRGPRRKRNFEQGFALSDHADWPALLQTVADTGAEKIFVTHGHSEVLARHLSEKGLSAQSLSTSFEGEVED